jgi:radical SAM superfamily enzyme YgiQ (UPF0313 family)
VWRRRAAARSTATSAASGSSISDDIAFLQRESYEELADAIEAAGLTDMSFSCETRADLVMKNPDTFKRWKEIGLHMVFLGIEKMDDDGLDSVRKRTKGGALTNLAAIEYLEECGISPLASLIADPGWDDEDFDRLEETVKRASTSGSRGCTG